MDNRAHEKGKSKVQQSKQKCSRIKVKMLSLWLTPCNFSYLILIAIITTRGEQRSWCGACLFSVRSGLIIYWEFLNEELFRPTRCVNYTQYVFFEFPFSNNHIIFHSLRGLVHSAFLWLGYSESEREITCNHLWRSWWNPKTAWAIFLDSNQVRLELFKIATFTL